MSIHHLDAADRLVVQRWRRHGFDRAFVKRDGREIGFRDLDTGAVWCPDAADAPAVERATADLLAHVVRPDGEDDQVVA